jgi:hypothetical protein
MKGQRGDLCGSRDCYNGNAQYYNYSTRRYYCEFCAEALNVIFEHNQCVLTKATTGKPIPYSPIPRPVPVPLKEKP